MKRTEHYLAPQLNIEEVEIENGIAASPFVDPTIDEFIFDEYPQE